jgi:hypothetical protein
LGSMGRCCLGPSSYDGNEGVVYFSVELKLWSSD